MPTAYFRVERSSNDAAPTLGFGIPHRLARTVARREWLSSRRQRIDYCIAWAALMDPLSFRVLKSRVFLRHQCERFACALGLEATNPHVGIKEDNKKLVTHFKPLVESSLVVDRLFGSRYQGECLFVTNAEPVSSEEKQLLPFNLGQPWIALQGQSWNSTCSQLNSRRVVRTFKGSIRARHPAGVLTQEGNGFPYEYALLLAALLSLDTLGGDKSVGLGRCEIRLKEETLCWNSQCISSDEAFQSFKDEPEEWGSLLEMLREVSTE